MKFFGVSVNVSASEQHCGESETGCAPDGHIFGYLILNCSVLTHLTFNSLKIMKLDDLGPNLVKVAKIGTNFVM